MIDKFTIPYRKAGRRQKGLLLMEHPADARKRTRGGEHPEFLGSMILEYSNVGRRQEALQLTEHVVEAKGARSTLRFLARCIHC